MNSQAELFIANNEIHKRTNLEGLLEKEKVRIELGWDFFGSREAVFADGSSLTFNHKNEIEVFD